MAKEYRKTPWELVQSDPLEFAFNHASWIAGKEEEVKAYENLTNGKQNEIKADLQEARDQFRAKFKDKIEAARKTWQTRNKG